MSLNLSTVKTVILAWLRRETGITIIEAKQNRPIPKLPYGTFWIPNAGGREGGIDELRYGEDGVSQHGLRTMTVSINIYGPGANDRMSRVMQSLDWPKNIEDFNAAGIAHVGEVGPQDLTGLWDTQQIERSQLDIRLSYSFARAEEEDEIGSIDEVEITHEGTPMGDDTFTVSRDDE